MKIEDIENKTLALVLWEQVENGEGDVVVYPGVLIKEGESYFLQREKGGNPEIQEPWLARVKQVPSNLKDTLMGCEYELSLTVGNVNGAPEGFEKFGLKWPK
jgi:hypothetical protein